MHASCRVLTDIWAVVIWHGSSFGKVGVKYWCMRAGPWCAVCAAYLQVLQAVQV